MNCLRAGFVKSPDMRSTPSSAPSPSGSAETPPSTSRLIASLAGFLVVGAPLAMIAWHELSEVLSGRFIPLRMLEGFAALVALAATAMLLARSMKGAGA